MIVESSTDSGDYLGVKDYADGDGDVYITMGADESETSIYISEDSAYCLARHLAAIYDFTVEEAPDSTASKSWMDKLKG